jgi:hypothetical protein
MYDGDFLETRQNKISIDVTEFNDQVYIIDAIINNREINISDVIYCQPLLSYFGINTKNFMRQSMSLNYGTHRNHITYFAKFLAGCLMISDITDILKINGFYDKIDDELNKIFDGITPSYIKSRQLEFMYNIQDRLDEISILDLEHADKTFLKPLCFYTNIVGLELEILASPLLNKITEIPILWNNETTIINKIVEITNGFINPAFIELFPGLIISGGLMSTMVSRSMSDVDKYIEEFSPDLDIFVTGLNYPDRRGTVVRLADYIVNSCFDKDGNFDANKQYYVAYSKNILVVYRVGARVPVQFVLSNYLNEWDLINSFDFTHLQVVYSYYNGLRITPKGFISHYLRLTEYGSRLHVKEKRLYKAVRAGFSVGYHRQLEEYMNLFINFCDIDNKTIGDAIIENGRQLQNTVSFPSDFNAELLLEYLGSQYTLLIYSDLVDMDSGIDSGKICIDGNFRNPLFILEYDSLITTQYTYDYSPVILHDTYYTDYYTIADIISTKIVFVFQKCIVDKLDGCYNITFKNRINWFMILAFSEFIEKTKKLFGDIKTVNTGSIFEPSDFKIRVLEQYCYNKKILNSLGIIEVPIIKTCPVKCRLIDSCLYIYMSIEC